MFKGRQNKKEPKGIAAAPYSSVPGCIGAIVLVIFGIWSILNLTDVIKWVGMPFMIIPDAIGIVDRPTKNEVARVSGLAGSEHVIILTRTGRYNLFRNIWDEWGIEEGQFAHARIEGSSGRIPISNEIRKANFYDTPAGRGTVVGQFDIDQPGEYIVRFMNTSAENKKFEASLVPDFITGNEAALRNAFFIQIALILILLGIFVYFRKIKPMQTQVRKDFKNQDKKRDSMDDFLHDMKRNR